MIHSSYSDVLLQPLIDFSKKVYGKNAYQASKYFLKWALSNKYLEISTTDTKSGEVYSMISSMRIDTGLVYFKSFFNYITDEEQRGAGIKHLGSIRRENNFFIPAVSDPGLSKSYKHFGADQIPFNWFKRVLLPFPNLPLLYKFINNKDVSIMDKENDIFISNKLCSARLSKISEVSGIADIEFIKWRLTSKNNNRVFVLEDNHDSALIIAVFGKRHHVPVIRIISCFGSSSTVKKLVDRACQLGCNLAAIVCLTTIYEKHSSDFFADKRYKLRDGINTFYKHADIDNKQSISNSECLMLCGDLGFEEQFEDEMGKLVISYDCEGVWGMLDKLDSLDETIFNRKSIVGIYKKIIRLHEVYQIHATFAFVGAFVSTKSEFDVIRKDYKKASAINNWCAKLDTVGCKFSEQDIHIPELLDMVKSSKVDHEIAIHGYSHVIMKQELDELSLKFELEGIKTFSESKNLNISTIIFPRNVVNYKFLEKADYIYGFRAPPRQIISHKTIKRALSLLKEFWPICRSENLKMHNTKTIIPGDFFINWRSGLRRFVPIWLTIFRFRIALNHACKHDGIVHIWLHPHNLLTGKDQLELLSAMLSVVNKYKSNSCLKVLAQKDCIFSNSNL